MPFARLKPINALTGNIVERYSSPYGNVFRVEVGWYEVSDISRRG